MYVNVPYTRVLLIATAQLFVPLVGNLLRKASIQIQRQMTYPLQKMESHTNIQDQERQCTHL